LADAQKGGIVVIPQLKPLSHVDKPPKLPVWKCCTTAVLMPLLLV
jgi:hypothetical protein